MLYSVDQVAKAADTTWRALRFWESQGLLGTVGRNDRGARKYSQAQMDAVKIITAAKVVGMELSEIKKLLDTWDIDKYREIQDKLENQKKVLLYLSTTLPRPEASGYDL